MSLQYLSESKFAHFDLNSEPLPSGLRVYVTEAGAFGYIARVHSSQKKGGKIRYMYEIRRTHRIRGGYYVPREAFNIALDQLDDNDYRCRLQ